VISGEDEDPYSGEEEEDAEEDAVDSTGPNGERGGLGETGSPLKHFVTSTDKSGNDSCLLFCCNQFLKIQSKTSWFLWLAGRRGKRTLLPQVQWIKCGN
jgi:hypothetical protein